MATLLWLALGLLAALAYSVYKRCVLDVRGLPPGPRPLPLLDNMLSLEDPQRMFQSLQKLRTRYGDTFTLWFGGQPMVLINRLRDIKKYFTGDFGEVTAGRAQFAITDIFQGANTGIISSEGEVWREARRFSLHTLRDFGVGKAVMEVAIREEAQDMLDYLDTEVAAHGSVDPSDAFAVAVINVVSRVIFGHSFPRGDPKVEDIRQALNDFFDIFSSPLVALLSWAPWLRYIPLFGHFGADAGFNFNRKILALVGAEIAAVEADFDPSNEPRCFIEAYLKEMAERKGTSRDNGLMSKFQLNRIIGDFWTAGFETTVTTLRWAPVFLTNFPEAQTRMQEEIDAFYGAEGERPISMADRSELPYTAAAVMELQRLANIISVNVQHRLLADAEIDGFQLKKGTVIVPQIASLLHDAEIFPEPLEYKPERFLTEDGKLRTVEAFMPFSLGKRACAGEPLARAELWIFFVALVRRFRVSADPLPSRRAVPGAAIRPYPYQIRLAQRH